MKDWLRLEGQNCPIGPGKLCQGYRVGADVGPNIQDDGSALDEVGEYLHLSFAEFPVFLEGTTHILVVLWIEHAAVSTRRQFYEGGKGLAGVDRHDGTKMERIIVSVHPACPAVEWALGGADGLQKPLEVGHAAEAGGGAEVQEPLEEALPVLAGQALKGSEPQREPLRSRPAADPPRKSLLNMDAGDASVLGLGGQDHTRFPGTDPREAPGPAQPSPPMPETWTIHLSKTRMGLYDLPMQPFKWDSLRGPVSMGRTGHGDISHGIVRRPGPRVGAYGPVPRRASKESRFPEVRLKDRLQCGYFGSAYSALSIRQFHSSISTYNIQLAV